MKKKRVYLFLLCFLVSKVILSQNNLVITEIMYNDPSSGTDTLEFIEITNNSDSDINLENYSMYGVTCNFPEIILSPNNKIVICYDSLKFLNFYNYNAYEWQSGSLSNSGEIIKLIDSEGKTIDSVNYKPNSGWPSNANGNGNSLVLCDINSDNSLPSNWTLSENQINLINSIMVYASPGFVDNGCNKLLINEYYNLSENVFPNPTNGILNINSEKPIKQIYVYNQCGQILKMIENIDKNDYKIILDYKIKGLIYLKIIYENNFSVYKISVF